MTAKTGLAVSGPSPSYLISQATCQKLKSNNRNWMVVVLASSRNVSVAIFAMASSWTMINKYQLHE
jgi:hypothetical protein